MHGQNVNGREVERTDDMRKRVARRNAIERLSSNIHAGIIGFSVALAFSHGAYALPQNGQVKAGSAAIVHSSPTRLDIHQASEKAVINWGSFSITEPEHTNFNQPSASSVTLNRVVGNDLSTIAGTLTANGNIVLINPNGIFFSPTARVDVNGLIATTSDIGNDDFMAGRYNFLRALDPSSAVVNQGQITVAEGGLAAFVAPWVENSGAINARLGRVAMASGEAFTLDLYGDNLIQLAVPTGSGPGPAPAYATGNALVANSGTIAANGGIVTLSVAQAKSVVDSVINMDGVIEARAVEQRGGTIVLHGGDSGVVQIAGRLDASGDRVGQTGGTVKVLGEKVGLFAGAEIDVSGDAGGGTALIGGNYKGAGPEANARQTIVAPGATIDADAHGAGDGGRVIVWADETTQYYGEITARGGADGGDGGFVETSGKQNLAFRGMVDVSAANGTDGTILLDPRDIHIVNPGVTEFPDSESNIIAFVDGGDLDFTFWASQIEGLDGNVILEATRDIFVSELLNLTNLGNGESFILQAGRDIDVNAPITTVGGNIHLEADSPHSTVGASDGVGHLNVNATLTSGNGSITLIGTGVLIGAFGEIDAGTGAISFTLGNGGAITIAQQDAINDLGTTGTVSIGRAVTAGRPEVSKSEQTAQAAFPLLASGINLSGAIDMTAAPFATVEMYAAGDIVISNLFSLGQDLVLNADADSSGIGAIVDGGGTISVGSNFLELYAGSGIGTSGNPIALTGNPSIFANTDTGGVYLNVSESSGVVIDGSSVPNGDFELTSTGPVDIVGGEGTVLTGGNVSIASSSHVEFLNSNAIDAGGNVNIDSGNAITALAGNDNNPEIIAGGDVTLTAQVIGNADSMLEIGHSGSGTGVLEISLSASGDASNSFVDLLTGSFIDFRVSLAEAQDSLEVWFSGEGSWALVDIDGIAGPPSESHVFNVDPGFLNFGFSYELLDPTGIMVVDTGTIVASGDVTLNSIGDLIIGTGSGTAIDATGGSYAIRLESQTGAIVSNGGTVAMGGDELFMLAATGVGSVADPVLIEGNAQVAASATVSGGIYIEASNNSFLTIGTADGGLNANGDIVVTSFGGEGGGDINVTELIDAGGNVVLDASGGMSATAEIASGGSVEILAFFDILAQDISSVGNLTLTTDVDGGGATTLAGDSYITAGGNFIVNGPTIVADGAGPIVDVSGGDDTAVIAFNDTLDSQLGEGGGGDLTLVIGASGHITLGDTVGGAQPLGTLTLTRLGGAVGLSQTAPAIGDEDTAIALNLNAGSADEIVVSDIPAGAIFDGASVTPPEHSDDDFVLTVTGTDTGIAYVTLPDTQPTFADLAETGAQTLVNNLGGAEQIEVPVTVLAVADTPIVSATDATGTAGTPIPLTVEASLVDTDSSESLSIVLAGLPEGAALSAGTPNEDGSYTLTTAELDGLTLTAAPATAGIFTLTLEAISTEEAGDNPGKDVTSASDNFSVAITPIVTVPPGVIIPQIQPGNLPTLAVLYGRPARFRDVTPSTVRLTTTSELAEVAPPATGEDTEQTASESGFTEACPDVALASMSWQNTPADASFNVDPSQIPYSVNVYCGGYKLSDAGRGAYGEYETLTFVTRDFWTDFKQSIQPRPVDELLAIMGLLPKGKVPPSARP